MKKLAISAACMLASIGSGAEAQSTYYWPAPVAAAQQGRMASFPMGTALTLTTRTQVSTKDNKPGDRFYLEVAESLSYRGQVVIPAGSIAVGEVARADRNGYFGQKGKLDIRLLYVETPSGPIRLSGRSNNEGVSGTAASIATIVFVSPLGFLIHGTSAKLAADTTVTAYLADDLRFTVNTAVADTPVQPDTRMLPARFDPSVFSSVGSR